MSVLTEHQEHPPQPVLTVEVAGEIRRKLKTHKPKNRILKGQKSEKICKSYGRTKSHGHEEGDICRKTRTLTIRIHLMRDRPKPEMAP